MLWLISDADENRLDRYEGFPRFYQKETIEVEQVMERIPDTADRIDAWTPHGIRHGLVYIMTDGSPYGTPSKRYMSPICRAYFEVWHGHRDPNRWSQLQCAASVITVLSYR